MRHLTPTELLDVIETSSVASAARAHIEACAVCRTQAAQLATVLDATRRLEVPEPSPLFWDRLSDRVRGAIEAEPVVRRRFPWMQWPVLVSGAGLALLVLALVSTVPSDRDAGDGSGVPLVMDGASDSAWDLVSELVGPLDIETARAAGIAPAPGAADQAVLQLSAVEREELVRLLRQELEQPGL